MEKKELNVDMGSSFRAAGSRIINAYGIAVNAGGNSIIPSGNSINPSTKTIIPSGNSVRQNDFIINWDKDFEKKK